MIGAAAKILGSTLTRYVGGVILNAALSGSNQPKKSDTKGLEDSSPGTLSQSAVSTETGGAIFDKVLGKKIPRRESPKVEVPEPAKVPQQKVESDRDLERAAADLLNDPDSLSVSDAELKNHVVKIFGGGILPMLIRTEAKAVETANNVRALNQNLLNTQGVFVDQTNILASKLDQILDIFGDQLEYQKQVKDRAEAQRKLDKLSDKKDASSFRAFLSTSDSKKRGKLLNDMMKGFGTAKILSKLQGLEKLGKGAKDFLSSFSKVKTPVITDAGNIRKVSKFVKDRSEKAKSAEAARRVSTAQKASKAKRTADLRKLADALGIDDISDLYRELKAGGIGALQDMYNSGFITPAEMSEYRDAVGKIGLDVSDIPDPVPNWEKPPSGKIEPYLKKDVPTLADDKVKKKPLKTTAAKVTPRQASTAVDKMLSSPQGAAKIMKPAGAAKATGRFGKLVPGVGTAIALGEAAYRFSNNDIAGGIMSIGSAIPILGWGFVAADIARDMGFDPLNTKPKEYETGTGLTERGPAVLHGTEAVIGKSGQEELLASYRESIDMIGSNLVSVSVALGNATGDSSEIKSLIKKSGLDYDIVPMSFNTDIGRHKPIGGLRSEQANHMSALKDMLSGFSSNDVDIRENQRGILDKLLEEGKINLENFRRPLENPNPDDSTTTSNPGRNGSYASGTWIGNPGDDDGNQTGLNMNLPGGIGTPIYAPIDLIYKTVGTDGNPAVGLDGNADALGPKGKGFGYYGAYFFEKDGKEYEVLLGHFRDMPRKGTKDGDIIPKGTLLGYQGASGRSVSRTGGVYPHISLHVNGIGFNAGNDVLKWFANGLASITPASSASSAGSTSQHQGPTIGNGGKRGGGGDRQYINKTLKHLQDDESLSSLSPGVNDYIRPNSRSVVTNKGWGDISDDTLIYPYLDSKGTPTIGWGITYYDSLLSGKKKVKMSDPPLTKRQVDGILRNLLNGLVGTYSKKIPTWNKMTDSQKAGVLVVGYNAPYAAIGGYPNYTRALAEGDWATAARESNRKGPSAYRLNLEKQLIRGPKIEPKRTRQQIEQQIQENDYLRYEKYKNRPDLYFGSNFPQGTRANNLMTASSMTEDAIEGNRVAVQVVYVNNDTFISQSNNKPKSSRGTVNFSEQYRMAVLGA